MSLEGKIPLFDLRFAMSVRIGNVLVHVNGLETTLSRYCEAAHCIPSDGARFVSLAGSMSLVKYKNVEFGIVTQHQLKGYDIETLALPAVEPRRYITSNGYIFIIIPIDAEKEDRHDVGAFRFDEPVADGALFGGNFFPLTEKNVENSGDLPTGYLAYGHAYADQKIEVEEDIDKEPGMTAFHLVKRVCLCKSDGQPSDSSLLRLKAIGGAPFDSNGFSGGPVFSVVPDQDGSHTVKFSGMMCRGGTGTTFHAIKGDILIKVLDGMIQELAK